MHLVPLKIFRSFKIKSLPNKQLTDISIQKFANALQCLQNKGVIEYYSHIIPEYRVLKISKTTSKFSVVK